MSWIITASGRKFEPWTPTADSINLHDIAWSLAHLGRFNGHAREFYSVAQHSVMVADLVPKKHRWAALLHDAVEAYIGDLVSPIKRQMPDFSELEHRIWFVMAEKYDLPKQLPAEIKKADLRALAAERRDLIVPHPEPWPCLEGITPPTASIRPLSPRCAYEQFIEKIEAMDPVLYAEEIRPYWSPRRQPARYIA